MNEVENAMDTKSQELEVSDNDKGLNRFVKNVYNAGVRI